MVPFLVCFESHRHPARVWAVKQRGKWRFARTVHIQVPIETVYKGPTARQPRAYFVGAGIVERSQRGVLVIR